MNSLKCLFLSLIIGMAVFPFDSLADLQICPNTGQFLVKQLPFPGVARKSISVEDVIRQAEATVFWRDQDAILVDYAQRNGESLSVDDVIDLANATGFYQAQDGILVNHARYHRESISLADARRLAKATFFDSSHDTILRIYRL